MDLYFVYMVDYHLNYLLLILFGKIKLNSVRYNAVTDYCMIYSTLFRMQELPQSGGHCGK
jgi:hypothetical protein